MLSSCLVKAALGELLGSPDPAQTLTRPSTDQGAGGQTEVSQQDNSFQSASVGLPSSVRLPRLPLRASGCVDLDSSASPGSMGHQGA